jgi:hypothetical protein
MGTVQLKERPRLPISPRVYRLLLAQRFQQLMTDADPLDLELLLSQLEKSENVRLLGKPDPAEILVESSSRLRELAAYPSSPIPPQAWKPDPETGSALENETLETLNILVR